MKHKRSGYKTIVGAGLMMLAVTIIVFVPWTLANRMVAAELTGHDAISRESAAVSAYTRIRSALGNIDRGVFWLVLNPSRAQMRVEIARARERIQIDLDFLRRHMANNTEHQALIGQLQGLVDARRAEVDRILAHIDEGNSVLAQQFLVATGSAMPLRELDDILVQQHEEMIKRHRELTESQRARFARVSMLVAGLQLALLALLLSWAVRLWFRRNRVEAQTRLARRRADRILATVREPIVQLDPELRVRLSNPAFSSLYSAGGNLVGSRLAEIGNGAWDDAALIQKLRDVLSMNRELWDYELEQESTVSGRRTVLVNAWRMQDDEESGVDSLILTATDITARRNAERQVGDLNQQLNARVQEISEINADLESFNYSVSHDLRAPLRHIAAYSGKLEREAEIDPDSRAAYYLRVIGDSAVRMAIMIDELLTYSRLGRSPVRTQPVDMVELVNEVRVMLEDSTPDRDVTWHIGDLPVVQGDTSLLRLVWQNLLGNAVKYTGGRDRAVIRIEHGFDTRGNEHVFTVADNGAGFDMAYVDKLFGVFQRLHGPEEFPGTGIGLANVRRSIQRLGGRVWAEGELDQGARFSFTVPAGIPFAPSAIEGEP